MSHMNARRADLVSHDRQRWVLELSLPPSPESYTLSIFAAASDGDPTAWDPSGLHNLEVSVQQITITSQSMYSLLAFPAAS